MKIKKALTLGCLLPLITSCGKNPVVGTYAFQMGKEKGTHFGLYLDLSNDDFTGNEKIVGYKKMNFSFNVSFPEGDSEEMVQVISTFLGFLKEENSDDYTVDGYYQITDEKNKSGEKRMKVGFSFDYLLDTVLELYKSIKGSDLSEEQQEIIDSFNDVSLIESVIYTTYATNEVNMYIPVSMEDLYYQLYWYGYDIKINAETYDVNVVKVTQHDAGTIPTKEEVDAINETFIADHEGMKFLTYRAFNVLKLTLIKK